MHRYLIVFSLIFASLAPFTRAEDLNITAAEQTILDRVTDYHRGPGPWAVIGYRIGLRMLKELGIEKRNDFALEIIHSSPREVQFSCVMDGLQAATGASLGKLNLSFEIQPDWKKMTTVAKNRKSKKTISVTLKPEFSESILNLPYAQYLETSISILRKTDDDLFTVKEKN